jgi:hypothetical protein
MSRRSRQEELEAQLPTDQQERSRVEDFRYDVSQDGFWEITNRKFIKEPRAVNAMIPTAYWRLGPPKEDGKQDLIKPSTTLMSMDNELVVESSIWWPGMPQIIRGYFSADGGDVVPDPRRTMFNSYWPQTPPKTKKKADLWVKHVKKLWPEPKEHNFFFDYCAHMVQRPQEKANAIITLSGDQGIGKDMALDPVKEAVGRRNARDIEPGDFLSNYNPWIQCVMLIINEMRPWKEDFHASSLYDKLKQMSVTPPNTLALSEKYMKMRYVVNVLRIFITTNNMSAIYIPPNDRRFSILHSPLKKGWAGPDYFNRLGDFYNNGGMDAVAAWLWRRDISKFQPKRQPDPTTGWQSIITGWTTTDDATGIALDKLGNPDALFPKQLLEGAKFSDDEEEIRTLLRFPRKLVHRMLQNGYFVLPLDPPLEFRKGDRVEICKKAFVKQEFLQDRARVQEILIAAGRKLFGEDEPDNVVPLREVGT